MIIGKLDIRNGDEGEVELTTKDGMQISEGWTDCGSNPGRP